MVEFFVTIGICGVLVLLPPILAIWALRQFRTASSPGRWRVALAWAVLADWILLVAFWVLHHASKVGKHYTTTRLADGFLLITLLLLIGAAVRSSCRWKLSFAAVVLLCSWTGTEQLCAFDGEGSSLSVLITMAEDKVVRSPGDSTFVALHKMANYQKRGYYDAAIDVGKAWTTAYPIDGSNDKVFIGIASAYLAKARRDRAHADDYIREALLYRDKALATASDPELGVYSMSTIHDLAVISEYAGDLSAAQRCVQYRNTIKLYDHLITRLTDKRDEITHRFVPDPNDLTVADVDCWADQTHDAMAEVREKQKRSACQ